MREIPPRGSAAEGNPQISGGGLRAVRQAEQKSGGGGGPAQPQI